MIIGLTGLARSGKSTVAKYVSEEHSFKRLNFKDGLVAEMLDNLPDVLNELKDTYACTLDELFKEKPPTMRALMQNYGTEVRRGDDPDYWVKKWKEQADELAGNIVVDDVRFINEAKAVTDNGGIIVRVSRPDRTEKGYSHKSETEQNDIEPDFTIISSTGDLAGLYREIENVIHILKTNSD